MFRFEYDENKSTLNLQKHGINFDDAKKLWVDPDLIEIQAKTIDEERYLATCKINETIWSAVIDTVINLSESYR